MYKIKIRNQKILVMVSLFHENFGKNFFEKKTSNLNNMTQKGVILKFFANLVEISLEGGCI